VQSYSLTVERFKKNKAILSALLVTSCTCLSPVAGVLNLEMFGNNRFFAFLSALDHEVQECGGCTSDPLLAFSQFKMAPKMAAE